jgi:hypothetical protein
MFFIIRVLIVFFEGEEMKKTHLIRPADAKEYIGFQFQGLVETLELFDYQGVARVVRATQSIFDESIPEAHKESSPDCILLEGKYQVK